MQTIVSAITIGGPCPRGLDSDERPNFASSVPRAIDASRRGATTHEHVALELFVYERSLERHGIDLKEDS